MCLFDCSGSTGLVGVFAQTELSIFSRKKEWTDLRLQIAWIVALVGGPYLIVVYTFAPLTLQ